MSAGENVWPLIADLATALDGSRESSERTLDLLQAELRKLPRIVRDEARRQMIQIVAALSRLEVRLIDSDGPLPAGIWHQPDIRRHEDLPDVLTKKRA